MYLQFFTMLRVNLCRHGVRQFLSCWSDGTAYITQCPVRPGESFTHNFTVQGQIGTLLWHAHITWLRATLHGAIVILPKPGVRYPFDPQPDYAVPIILGTYPLLFLYILIIQYILHYFLYYHTRCWNSMNTVSQLLR